MGGNFMPLKFKYQKKEEIPAEHLSFYAERDGGWQLDADGVADKGKLDEFRTNTAALLKQLDEQRKRFEGIAPEEVRKLTAEKQRLEDEQRLKAGEFDKVLDGRLKGAKADWRRHLALPAAICQEQDLFSYWLDVLVHLEEVRRVVFLLELHQPVVDRPVGGLDAVGFFFGHEVDVGAAAGERL
jgi:hypothetical protein